MAKRLFVGNVAWSVTELELRELFSEAGEVAEVKVMLDRESGRPRGFAFVEMGDEGAAAQAINALNGRELGGRPLAVKEALERSAAVAAVVVAVVAAWRRRRWLEWWRRWRRRPQPGGRTLVTRAAPRRRAAARRRELRRWSPLGAAVLPPDRAQRPARSPGRGHARQAASTTPRRVLQALLTRPAVPQGAGPPAPARRARPPAPTAATIAELVAMLRPTGAAADLVPSMIARLRGLAQRCADATPTGKVALTKQLGLHRRRADARGRAGRGRRPRPLRRPRRAGAGQPAAGGRRGQEVPQPRAWPSSTWCRRGTSA